MVDQPEADQDQALVVGIGTGFNVSPVLRDGGRIACLSVEAGHASLYASLGNALDQLKPGLSRAFPTVEALFSGKGRRRFLSLVTGEPVERATPYIGKFGEAGNEVFDAALDHYAALIGYLLKELQLDYMPTSGIFLAGGVARSSLIGSRAALCSAVSV